MKFQSRKSIGELLVCVTYPGYTFEVGGVARFWIRARFIALDSVQHDLQMQHTRKWYVSRLACQNEIVQTALKCVLTSVEHEDRENFRYRGKPIFGPHFNVDALHRICTDRELDYRDAPESAATESMLHEVA